MTAGVQELRKHGIPSNGSTVDIVRNTVQLRVGPSSEAAIARELEIVHDSSDSSLDLNKDQPIAFALVEGGQAIGKSLSSADWRGREVGLHELEPRSQLPGYDAAEQAVQDSPPDELGPLHEPDVSRIRPPRTTPGTRRGDEEKPDGRVAIARSRRGCRAGAVPAPIGEGDSRPQRRHPRVALVALKRGAAWASGPGGAPEDRGPRDA